MKNSISHCIFPLKMTRTHMLVVLSFLFLTLSPCFIYAQGPQGDRPCGKIKKKAWKLYDKSRIAKSDKERYSLLIEAIKKDDEFVEAYDELAGINFAKSKRALDNLNVQQAKSFENIAIGYWKKILEKCPEYRNYIFYLKTGRYYYKNKEYKEAKKYLSKFVESESPYKKEKKEAEELIQDCNTYFSIMENPVPFEPEKVDKVSTKRDEYLPMLSPDNRYMFLTRKQIEDTKSMSGRVEKELFVQSRKMYKAGFSRGIPMSGPFNKGDFQGGVSVSVDNKLLFITIVEQVPHPNYPGRLFDNADIFYSEWNEGEWSDLKSIGGNINGRHTWEGQPSISADNKVLYFASAREKDNKGGMDLYKSIRRPDGSWGDPVNLGDSINTFMDEKTPFMHSDSYTLYFSSNGHIGVGGFDIFYSKMKRDSTFQEPTNIGYPINTADDEHGFFVSRDGKYGYFTSDIEGSLDIYSFELYEKARPEKVVFVKGEITDSEGDPVEDVKIELKNTKNKKKIEGVVDDKTGEYVAVMSVEDDEDIIMTGKKKGFAFTSQYISSDEDVIGKVKRNQKMKIDPIEVGKSYRINDINFATDSYELTPQAMNILDEFIEFLELNPGIKISIEGHTDNVGDPKENMILSEQRAKAVFSYLTIEGIDPGRMEYKGYGETKPIASNDTEEGRAENRRTEFVVVEK